MFISFRLYSLQIYLLLLLYSYIMFDIIGVKTKPENTFAGGKRWKFHLDCSAQAVLTHNIWLLYWIHLKCPSYFTAPLSRSSFSEEFAGLWSTASQKKQISFSLENMPPDHCFSCCICWIIGTEMSHPFSNYCFLLRVKCFSLCVSLGYDFFIYLIKISSHF